MGFGQSLSGLNAASSDLDVIGNNIANSATVGFKSGTAAFADVFASSRVGLGVQVSGVNQKFAVGTVTTTSNELDMAIDGGNGFFRLLDTDGSVVYSRNGQFFKNANNEIVNAQGQRLSGYAAGAIGSDPVALTILVSNLDPQATRSVSANVNLDANAEVIAATPAFDPSNQSTYSSSTPLTVYDSLGNSHRLDQYFIKREGGVDPDGNAVSSWEVQYALDGQVVAGNAQTMTFDVSGRLLTPAGAVALTFADPGGADSPAADLVASFDYTGSTQFGGDFRFTGVSQDGYTTGEYSGVSVSADGTLLASYTNGMTQSIGTVALASFRNNQGLKNIGGNAWVETGASGPALVGQPGSNGLATLVGQAVEASNVDMSQELVNMIIAQRTYQANAQTIKTQDNILQTLVTMR